MAINKVVLEKDGLVVGTNQLVASGGGVYVGNNLVVANTLYIKGLADSTGSIGPANYVLASNGSGGVIWVGNVATTSTSTGTGTGGTTVTISDTAPANPTAGNLWWNSVIGAMFIYYNDGDSNQWVLASPAGAGVTGPIGYTGSKGGTGAPAYTYNLIFGRG